MVNVHVFAVQLQHISGSLLEVLFPPPSSPLLSLSLRSRTRFPIVVTGLGERLSSPSGACRAQLETHLLHWALKNASSDNIFGSFKDHVTFSITSITMTMNVLLVAKLPW